MSYDINSTDLKVALMWSVPDNLDKGIKAFGKVRHQTAASRHSKLLIGQPLCENVIQ